MSTLLIKEYETQETQVQNSEVTVNSRHEMQVGNVCSFQLNSYSVCLRTVRRYEHSCYEMLMGSYTCFYLTLLLSVCWT